MSETVTVKSFQPGNDWTSDDGKIKLTFYECVFDRNGQDFTATWNKKQGTGDPPVGEPIEGEFSEKKPGDWRFRKASKPQGGGSNGGGGKRYSPDQQAAIQRQHSQGCAVEYAAVMQNQGRLPDNFGPDDLRVLIDWFELDIERTVAS